MLSILLTEFYTGSEINHLISLAKKHFTISYSEKLKSCK